MTPFENCARNKSLGIDFTGMVDTVEAYQKYLKVRWDNDTRTPTWYGVSGKYPF